MRARPRAAFVVTVSIAGSLLAACHKEAKDQEAKGSTTSSACEPPDCHMNPPPPPPTNRPPIGNPPGPVHDGGRAILDPHEHVGTQPTPSHAPVPK